MSIEVNVPALPESVADATIVAWRKQAGDAVKRDEPLVDLETDKVVLEVPSPADGVLENIHHEEGAVVSAGDLLAKINTTAAPSDEVVAPVTIAVQGNSEDAVITPSAKKMIAENNLDGSLIQGSGKGGRVLKEDVMAFMSESQSDSQVIQETQQAVTEQVVVAQSIDSVAAVSTVDNNSSDRIEKRVPMTRLRARIAERLLDAQHNAAILTTFNEVNMKPVMDLRLKYKDLFEKKYDTKLGFMSFFVKASIEALKRYPAVNASIDGNDIVYHGYFDIGVAVASPRGLVVPVLRNADQMNLAEIERGISDFVNRAKNNQLTMDDMTGGTFSLTNGGVFGSMMSTPIINPPQSGILGMHKIQPRPIVENGEIVARPMMYLALSYDHRIIDGAEAVQFLVTIKDVLEDPARMLVGV